MPVDREDYEGDYQDHLLEQYLSFVESSKEVSKRRLKNNKFFVTLLSVLAVVISLAESMSISGKIPEVALFSISLLGLSFSILWLLSIWSYKQINSGKYDVIHDFEQMLPFNPYDKEWSYLKEGKDWRTYLEHTKVELAIPLPLILIFLILALLNLPI